MEKRGIDISYHQGNIDFNILKGNIDFAMVRTSYVNFYEDQKYIYYYECLKSKYIIVKYIDGSEETVKEALKKEHITIKDLDEYKIDYIKYEKSN